MTDGALRAMTGIVLAIQLSGGNVNRVLVACPLQHVL